MDEDLTYLPPDGMCDYLFYDSLYAAKNSELTVEFRKLRPGLQHFIQQASNYSKTMFGVSFSPYTTLVNGPDNTTFFKGIDNLWGYGVSHFGFLGVFGFIEQPEVVKEALTTLKAIHDHLRTKMSSSRPSYYVYGKAYDYVVNDTELNLMKTIFTPSMFISIAHIFYPSHDVLVCRIMPLAMGSLPPNLKRGTDYSFGHTVNESLTVLRRIEKLGINIPTAISFTFRGVYFLPNFTNPSKRRPEDFMMFSKCKFFYELPYFDDPNKLCGNPNWTSVPPQLAYSIKLRRTITYLTMSTIATMACDAKQFHLNLDFGLVAYDVDADRAPPCKELGFNTQLGIYGRVLKMRELMDFLRAKYKKRSDNSVCKRMFAT
ncbi:hypothetical protein HPB50_010838 [Hyalomma asiaticum]|uniref:Uncharacterized protein n=1 Tax=Hyalomma asiaticum TaxID=266040 RepID=A0ACB7RNT9_HYAAI|nr:hypothetical protein HPB50_010838 [Hyalomma asiaticum]